MRTRRPPCSMTARMYVRTQSASPPRRSRQRGARWPANGESPARSLRSGRVRGRCPPPVGPSGQWTRRSSPRAADDIFGRHCPAGRAAVRRPTVKDGLLAVVDDRPPRDALIQTLLDAVIAEHQAQRFHGLRTGSRSDPSASCCSQADGARWASVIRGFTDAGALAGTPGWRTSPRWQLPVHGNGAYPAVFRSGEFDDQK